MSVENRDISRRKFTQLAFLGGMSFAFIRALQNMSNTARIVESLFNGGVISCSVASPQNLEVLAVLGAGIETFGDGSKHQPDRSSRIRLEAAAILARKYGISKVFLLNGRWPVNVDPNIFVKYFLEMLKDQSSNDLVCKLEINVEDQSVNTATNLQELKAKFPGVEVGIVTERFHITRAAQLACAMDINTVPFAAEDVIIGIYPNRKVEFAQTSRGVIFKEFVELMFGIVDHNSTLTTFIKMNFN